jgi:Na+-transporting NADH:ubiquinone oxidoreductase subunit C
VEAYIIPIDSRGLWGRILGYLAIKDDGSTISGFTVYKHSETPGLGGEIEQNWFQKNFVGKKIVNLQGNFVSIRIAKGAVDDIISKEKQLNYVDGISGATLTGKFLSEGLQDILRDYEPVSVRFRKNQMRKINP